MLIDYFIKNIGNYKEYYFRDFKIIIGIKNDKISFFKKHKYWLLILTENDLDSTNEIIDICDYIMDIFLKTFPNNKIEIFSNWYIFSNTADQIVFNNINNENTKKYKFITNKFVLINSLTGETFFNPEKIENNVLSKRISFLVNEYKNAYPIGDEKDKMFTKEISHLFAILEIILEDMI